jgi:hypothetical protein
VHILVLVVFKRNTSITGKGLQTLNKYTREKTMTLLEQTYRELRAAGLTHCAEAFSRDYLSKNKNWYAFQTHTGRDFSVAAAVQCLRSLRSRQASPGLEQEQLNAMAIAERSLLSHLNDTHRVADVL